MWTPDDDDRAEIARLIRESQRPAPDGWTRPADDWWFVASEEPATPEEGAAPEGSRWIGRAMDDERTETMAGLLLLVGAACVCAGVVIGWLLHTMTR